MKSPEEIAAELFTVEPGLFANDHRICLGGEKIGTCAPEFAKVCEQKFRGMLSDVVRQARQEMVEHGMGDSPVDIDKVLYGTKQREYTPTGQMYYSRIIPPEDAEKLVNHLLARIAFLTQERDLNEIWEEGYKAGLAERQTT